MTDPVTSGGGPSPGGVARTPESPVRRARAASPRWRTQTRPTGRAGDRRGGDDGEHEDGGGRDAAESHRGGVAGRGAARPMGLLRAISLRSTARRPRAATSKRGTGSRRRREAVHSRRHRRQPRVRRARARRGAGRARRCAAARALDPRALSAVPPHQRTRVPLDGRGAEPLGLLPRVDPQDEHRASRARSARRSTAC